MATRACFPGSFDPFTIAHLAIAEATRDQCGVDEVVLVLSTRTLGKEEVGQQSAQERRQLLEAVCVGRTWLRCAITKSQLLVDISAGFEWLVLGADKWAQINEVAWYGGSAVTRDQALQKLPRLAVISRPPYELGDLPPTAVLVRLADPALSRVSSTAVRAGNEHWRA